MNFLNKLNPFYWKKVADKCNELTTDLVNKNTRLTASNVELKEECRALRQKVEAFNIDLANRLNVEDSELAKRIATGEVSAVEAKLLLDLRLLRDETDNANEYARYAQETLTAEQQKVVELQATIDRLRKQNDKYFEIFTGVGKDEGILLTASHRGKTIVLDSPDVAEK